MKMIICRIAVVAMVVSLLPAVSAQVPGSAPGGVSAALIKVFGKKNAFSCQVKVDMPGNGGEAISMSMKMAYVDGRVRAEVDMATVKSAMLEPQIINQMKAMGMSRIVSITQPDKKKMLIVYPDMKALAEVPMSNEDIEAAAELKMEKKSLGKEKVADHPCEKNQLIFTDAKGKKQELLVWNATDLKGFPVKLEATEQGKTVIMEFKDIQMTKPDAKLFEAPSGFKKYDNIQELMMKQMMGNGLPQQEPKADK